ncbi:MAG TPA: DNA-binding response regulator [Candidatus Elarobacter sp.]
MTALRTAIVDDEALARERIRTLLAARDDVELVAECSNGRDAVAAIRKLRPALLLLDVQMPELDGFGVLEALPAASRPSAIVFITAYDRYAAGFGRVHRSCMVNVDRIFRVEPWTHGEYVIVLRNGTKVNSGRGYGERVRGLFE